MMSLPQDVEAIRAQRQHTVSARYLAAGVDALPFCLNGDSHLTLASMNGDDHTVGAIGGRSLIGDMILPVVENLEVTAVEGTIITFALTAYDEAGKIGEGTHKRAIITSQRFLEKVYAKL